MTKKPEQQRQTSQKKAEKSPQQSKRGNTRLAQGETTQRSTKVRMLEHDFPEEIETLKARSQGKVRTQAGAKSYRSTSTKEEAQVRLQKKNKPKGWETT